jgi:NitT/TauT family transport system ATP-binding protein
VARLPGAGTGEVIPPEEPEEAKISARGVERHFGAGQSRIEALGPFDLDIADGEFVSIVGPSGCGKSTFLRVIAGLIRPTAGRIAIRTRDSGNPTAMVFQEYSIYPWKTVLDNVRLGLDVTGVSKKDGNERALRYLTKLGLSDRARDRPEALSGGMKQRVAIARALAVEPDVLLMDEPFASLDAQMRTVLQEQLLELWQTDRRTVVFITHSLEEAILLGDRVAVMSARPGRLLESVDVPFERPRSPDIRLTPKFANLQAGLWDLLRREVDAHLAEQVGLGAAHA